MIKDTVQKKIGNQDVKVKSLRSCLKWSSGIGDWGGGLVHFTVRTVPYAQTFPVQKVSNVRLRQIHSRSDTRLSIGATMRYRVVGPHFGILEGLQSEMWGTVMSACSLKLNRSSGDTVYYVYSYFSEPMILISSKVLSSFVCLTQIWIPDSFAFMIFFYSEEIRGFNLKIKTNPEMKRVISK